MAQDAELLRGFPEIEWEDGYPTDESLAAFSAVDILAFGPAEGGETLRRELSRCAEECCASYDEAEAERYGKPVIRCGFSTGGWSGAEDVIEALLSKFWISHLHVQWNRGGHYIFEVDP